MLATEHATRLLATLTAIAEAVDEALIAAEALDGGYAAQGSDAPRWLPGIKQSLQRMQLECADVRFSAGELRDGLPSSETLQPRLLD
ncbi:MAG: hypothetical protein ACRDI2_12465 [Chloroflexota bacterium]